MTRTQRRLRVLISAGPTREPIDPIRFLSNYSTGYMGVLLTAEALSRGHHVTVVSGPSTEPFPPGTHRVSVETSKEMEHALRQHARSADIVIMAAAVADFRPTRLVHTKLHRRGRWTLQLRATPDIIGRLPRRAAQVIAGFSVETSHVIPRATRKLYTKRLDLLLAQQVNGSGGPFGRRPVEAWLLERTGKVTRLGRRSKPVVARVLLDKLERLWYGQRRRGGV